MGDFQFHDLGFLRRPHVFYFASKYIVAQLAPSTRTYTQKLTNSLPNTHTLSRPMDIPIEEVTLEGCPAQCAAQGFNV